MGTPGCHPNPLANGEQSPKDVLVLVFNEDGSTKPGSVNYRRDCLTALLRWVNRQAGFTTIKFIYH